MKRPAIGLQLFLGAVVLAAAGLGVAMGRGIAQAGAREFVLAALFAVLTFLGARFTLPLAPKVKLEVSTASVFAAALVLPVPLVMASGAAGHIAAAITLKRRWYNVLFNGAEVGLRGGVGSLLFGYLYGPIVAPTLSILLLTGTSALSALAMYGVNTILVAGVVTIRAGTSFRQGWLRGGREEGAPEASLYVLGFLAALLSTSFPWAIPLLVLPAAIVYFALKDRLEKMELADKLKHQMQELQRMQAELIQSARLASVGTLAAGVAHEINNPVFVISGNAELLLENPQHHLRSEQALKTMELIQEMAGRVSRIVSSLLHFSRSSNPREPMSLNKAIDEVLNLVEKSLIDLDIAIERRFDPDLPSVLGRLSQVEQVIMNIILNARDVMPRGGKLTITTKVQGNQVVASLADTGMGFSPQVQEHIFEPFFTTKEPGKGTGLGLYISRRIMQEHGGDILVASQQGKGAIFTLAFPLEPERETQPVATGINATSETGS